MARICFTMKTPDFDKAIKSLGKAKADKLLEKIKKLQEMENDHSLVPDGIASAELVFGKRLKKLNQNTYCLELGADRAMAVVIEKGDTKTYVWFWGGSHEDYNNKLKIKDLNEKENKIISTHSGLINEQIIEINKVKDNINNVREKSSHNYQDYQKYKKYS